MVRDIAGFYYDAERKKYFKIQPNHAGPGQQHSSQVIKQKESANKRRKIIHDHRTREARETISRSRLLTHPLLGRLSLRNQLGQTAGRCLPLHPSEDVAAYYAAGLSESLLCESSETLPGFAVDEKNGAIIFARSNQDNIGSDTLHCMRSVGPGRYSGISPVFEAMSDSFVDMSISVLARKLFYVSSGPIGSRVVLLEVPREEDDPHFRMMDQVWTCNDETAWQTAVSPTGQFFAIASSEGLTHYRMVPSHLMGTSMWVARQKPAVAEYMAVAFGQNDRIIMGGRRTGEITFFDERTNGFVTRLRHADAVSAIALVDDNRIVARGLQTMSLYDLRYTKRPSKKEVESKIATAPYRTFQWENSSLKFRLGFDYSSELGIIATGSSKAMSSNHLLPNHHQTIDLFSVRTGKKLRSLPLSTAHHTQAATCIKFSRIRSTLRPNSELRIIDNEPLSLLASSEGRILEWSCQGDEMAGSDSDAE
ncbi:hypothetical protein EPUS_04439 [Endocarpon pusillum Z07020]|uniref:Myocyte-specific enhancer factor 2d n=1 Tax=Endocarpon pusillum (strain Z07020 / HMAS-L-300199) TaxID=1263415 RepID=U1I3L5_ENDPU|nr:uncharacterized protein EPUS_04439 [Endocarpon pusillum Z07020]ERF76619.1 hypothetical protein EPUS_04439 [Endocarpon pusillum Z07020]